MPPPPPPPPQETWPPEIESGGVWQLADYPTLVFRIRAFLNIVIVNWNKYHNYDIIIFKILRGGGILAGGGKSLCAPPLYETL